MCVCVCVCVCVRACVRACVRGGIFQYNRMLCFKHDFCLAFSKLRHINILGVFSYFEIHPFSVMGSSAQIYKKCLNDHISLLQCRLLVRYWIQNSKTCGSGSGPIKQSVLDPNNVMRGTAAQWKSA